MISLAQRPNSAIEIRIPPALPFRERAPELRFSVLGIVFPQGQVRGDYFTLEIDRFVLCVIPAGAWSLTIGPEPTRTGADLLSLFEAFWGATKYEVAVRLFETMTAIDLSSGQRAAIKAVVDYP
jgi:hypothetical protein